MKTRHFLKNGNNSPNHTFFHKLFLIYLSFNNLACLILLISNTYLTLLSIDTLCNTRVLYAKAGLHRFDGWSTILSRKGLPAHLSNSGWLSSQNPRCICGRQGVATPKIQLLMVHPIIQILRYSQSLITLIYIYINCEPPKLGYFFLECQLVGSVRNQDKGGKENFNKSQVTYHTQRRRREITSCDVLWRTWTHNAEDYFLLLNLDTVLKSLPPGNSFAYIIWQTKEGITNVIKYKFMF